MHEHVDPLERVVPAVVGAQIESDELECCVEIDSGLEAGLHGGSHLVAPFETTNRTPHVVAGIQESLHRVLRDVVSALNSEPLSPALPP